MSKRVKLSNEKPPAKRACGFRLARSNPEAPVNSESSSSLFITVNTADQQTTGRTLTAETRVFSRSLESGGSPESASQSQNTPQNDDTLVSLGEMEDIEPTVQGDIQLKPKRKRNTTNQVGYMLDFDCY